VGNIIYVETKDNPIRVVEHNNFIFSMHFVLPQRTSSGELTEKVTKVVAADS